LIWNVSIGLSADLGFHTVNDMVRHKRFSVVFTDVPVSSESGLAPHIPGELAGVIVAGHIRKYDGEPFMPHHIVDGVKAQIGGETDRYVPYQEITV
jgi:hypothetical protein